MFATLGFIGAIKALFGTGTAVLTPEQRARLNLIRGALIALVLIVALFGLGYFLGNRAGTAKSKLAIANYVTELAQVRAQKNKVQTVIQTRVVTEHATAIQTVEKVKYVNREVVKEVPALAVDADGYPYIPMGVINVINAAAANRPATDEEARDTRDSGVSLPALGRTVSDNYSEVFRARADVKAWELWYELSYANWTSKNGQMPEGETP